MSTAQVVETLITKNSLSSDYTLIQMMIPNTQLLLFLKQTTYISVPGEITNYIYIVMVQINTSSTFGLPFI